MRTDQGCSIALEVFSGNIDDPSTLAEQINKIRDRFGLERVILVGDRGLITEARIRREIRLIHHHLEKRVRAHVFLCMPAYYVEWHMCQALVPVLFDDENPQQAQVSRSSVVAPAQSSTSAKAMASRKRTEDGFPVHKFRTLLKDPATVCKNRVQPHLPGAPAFDKITMPTSVQDKALKLLNV